MLESISTGNPVVVATDSIGTLPPSVPDPTFTRGFGIIRRLAAWGLWQGARIRQVRRRIRSLGLRIPRDWYRPEWTGEIHLAGVSFRMTHVGNELTCRSYWQEDYYEPYSMIVMRELAGETDWFFDVGANVGVFSLFVGSLGKVPRMVAFEPNPAVMEILGANVEVNGFPIECNRNALSDETAVRRLYFPASPTSASLEAEFNEIVERQTDIQAMRLDDLVFGPDAPARFPGPGRTVIKMDILGHESAVLRGGHRFIEECRPSFLLEAVKPYDPVEIDFLKANGYRFHLITESGLEEVPGIRNRNAGNISYVNLLVSTLEQSRLDGISSRLAEASSGIELEKTSLCGFRMRETLDA